MASRLTIRFSFPVAVTLLVPAGEPARAQSTPATQNLPSVTIEAQAQLEKRVQKYVGKITSSTRFQREFLARWSKPLCFEVAGLPRRDAEFMVSRLTKIALSVGAQVQPRECTRRKANFYVVFTPDPARTLKYLKWHPRLLFDRDASIGQINKFLADTTPLPVRVWHNGQEVGRYGRPIETNVYCAGYDTGFMPTNCESGASRVTLSASEGLTEAVIVFDANRINGMNMGQLSDYTAMAGLVDLEINADLADAPTILRLFTQEEGSRPQGLSEWDQAFLNATYHTDPKSVDQRGAIARVVAHDLAR